MKKNKDFRLEVLTQNWINNSEEAKNKDIHSHGQVFLKVKDTIISDISDGDWGLNETALALLKTVYNLQEEERIFYHGCDTITLMMSCPITIDWKVKREGKFIILSNFQKNPDTGSNPIVYKNLSVKLEFIDYAKIVYNFAKKVNEFYFSVEKTFNPEGLREFYDSFVNEYRGLFDRLEKGLKSGEIK